jgi:hypothetical protein
MMQTNSDKRNYLVVDISAKEKNEAKSLAKSKGMTFQGWLGQLIRNELIRNELKQEAQE